MKMSHRLRLLLGHLRRPHGQELGGQLPVVEHASEQLGEFPEERLREVKS